MTWLRKRHAETDDRPDVEAVRRALAATKKQTAKYEALAEELRHVRGRNHLAESLEAILRESR